MLNLMLGRYKDFISLTTPTTGKAAISGLNIGRLSRGIFLTYSVQDDVYPRLSEIAELKISNSGGTEEIFNIAFIDSWHTYESSLEALRLIENKMIDNSFIFVHDCFPPNLELISESFSPGSWCGVTFAAFRDYAMTSGRDWATVVDDYGLGILGPRNSVKRKDSSEFDVRWASMTMKEKIASYAESPISVMRGVQSSDFLTIIEAMEQRQDISPYINSNSTLKIPASNLALQRDVAIQQRDAMLESRSWRATKVFRSLKNFVTNK
ncbi:unannotated protein [freshwater metagenome]|uniref:Unannotated protein n=1 Tax=freshwater metagenome TaxID=449393 RepID=A0A6J7D3F1_9ZZZZ